MTVHVYIHSIEVREVGGRKVLVFEQKEAEDTTIATIAVRASTEHVLNDVERAIDDGVNAVRVLCSDGRLLAGAGAVELELCKQLKKYADEVLGLDQYAIRAFGEAFDVVPRTLAENTGCDSTSIMHTLHQSHLPEGTENFGFNIVDNHAFDAAKAGIFDVYATKLNALRLAVDAAITILRVDQIVMSKPAGGPKPRSAGPQDAD